MKADRRDCLKVAWMDDMMVGRTVVSTVILLAGRTVASTVAY